MGPRTHLAMLAPLLRLDGELRMSSGPLFSHLQILNGNGWDDEWRSLNRQLGDGLMEGHADVIRAMPPDALGPVLNEALSQHSNYKCGPLDTVLEAWEERVEAKEQIPGSEVALLENGVVARQRPELRGAWLKEALPVEGHVANFVHSNLVPPLFKSEVEALSQADLSLSERAHHLELAAGFASMIWIDRDTDPIGEAYTLHAAPWEKELLEAMSSKRELLAPFYSGVVATTGDRAENWKSIQPLLGRYPEAEWGNLAQAIGQCNRSEVPFTEQFDIFSSIAGRLKPEESADAVKVFANYNQLRGIGMGHDEAMNKALRDYLNPGAGDILPGRSGIDETDLGLNVGGVMIRKRR